MKPTERKPDRIFRIIDVQSGQPCGSYSRAYCDEYDFTTPEEARTANVHGVFEDWDKYRIDEYEVTYQLVREGVDEYKRPEPEVVDPMTQAIRDDMAEQIKKQIKGMMCRRPNSNR